MNADLELQALCRSGIKFSIEALDTGSLLVRLGACPDGPEVSASATTLDEAVAWLKDQVNRRYPGYSYAKGFERRSWTSSRNLLGRWGRKALVVIALHAADAWIS